MLAMPQGTCDHMMNVVTHTLSSWPPLPGGFHMLPYAMACAWAPHLLSPAWSLTIACTPLTLLDPSPISFSPSHCYYTKRTQPSRWCMLQMKGCCDHWTVCHLCIDLTTLSCVSFKSLQLASLAADAQPEPWWVPKFPSSLDLTLSEPSYTVCSMLCSVCLICYTV